MKRGKIEIGLTIAVGAVLFALALWVTAERMEFSSVAGIWVFFGFPGLALLLTGFYWLHEELPKALVGIGLVVFGLLLWINEASFVIVPVVVSGLGLLVTAHAVWRLLK
ncbi:hypothetical protein Dehly_1498 [Dehalogenimonas lykanthroporepellens BL-DC-9]|nr:hypothetical protein Dehly_1498 [Dehalogenimonas lykanthroporepellens BL-DC-9]